ncbi:Secreted beta-glucosidase sun1 [Penicillium oxalicum]|uniref:SUN domain-containing protein n=1 Tax=Penicillium oxalicum (strain 114-2 / CGMCC 5302) TaxID=933388 RepID=S7ZV02_PENO1|nr:Secreted beta-glucosidase sun1 [Penicillium oxalicum]EPS34254.1 SUN domain-containing protein [Penicillium oxalicum 114-2]KAI2794182.1 Secreted beta-glucosidase sun1 [Penicillium oxalicum]
MKFTVAATLATAGSLAAAHGHGHGHAHLHQRAAETQTETAVTAGPTVYDFVVMDPNSGSPKVISGEEACAGLAKHEFEWFDGAIPDACPPATSSADVSPTATVAAHVLMETAAVVISTTSSEVPTTTSTISSTSSTSSTSTSSTIKTSSTSSAAPTHTASVSHATGINAEFPDGEIDCNEFPSDYGAVALDYLGLGGYSGIQYVTIAGSFVTEIVTAITGNSCKSGAMCSYACPPGYQKSQWPTTQGSTGQSVGGLHCKNGKLYRTNPAFKTLCIEGTGGVHVRNELSNTVAVCRTDYPGTESETIPLAAQPGEVAPLTCPDANTYYRYLGKGTSAQYYVNNNGVSVEEGCQWGDGSKPVGNWAPMNLGVGRTDSGTWLSMFKNEPTTDADLNFKVKLVGDDLSDNCRYDGAGNFYNNAGLIQGNNGCTAKSASGNAYFVFYD